MDGGRHFYAQFQPSNGSSSVTFRPYSEVSGHLRSNVIVQPSSHHAAYSMAGGTVTFGPVHNGSETKVPPQSNSTATVERSPAVAAAATPLVPPSGATTPSDHTASADELAYPCGICHQEVKDDDEAILCERSCEKWFHRVCSGLTPKAYFLLTNESQAEWVCDKCIDTKKIPLEI